MARSYIGTPFHYQGRCKGTVIDCIGLITEIAKEIGSSVHDKPEFRRHKRRPSKDKGILFYMDQQFRRIIKYHPGDILVFWAHRISKRPQHLSVVTDKGMIHGYDVAKKVIEEPISSMWLERLVAAYEFPEVEPWLL